MTFTKKSVNDYQLESYGQESETAQAGKYCKVVGGVYNSTPPTIADGEASRLQTDATGNLMVSTQGETTSFQGTIVIPTSDTVVVGTLASTIDGLIRNVTVQTPALEGTGTATVELVDSLGGTVVGLAAQDESVITNYGTTQPISTSMEWTATANGTQSAAANIIFVAHYQQ